MTISHLLEEFNHHRSTPTPHLVSEDALEDARISAFENGYQAGWEDASAAYASEQRRISSDLSQNLQALSFTYHEAYSHLITSFQPLLEQMVTTILPRMAHATLGQHIVAEVLQMARDQQAGSQLELTLSPQDRSKVESMIGQELPTPVRLVSDESLGAGQVFLKIGSEERRIDMDGLLAGINSAVTSFLNVTGALKVDG